MVTSAKVEKRKFKAVIFDMDGVITDSEPTHMAAEHAVLKDHGVRIDSADWEGFRGKTTHAIFSAIIGKYQLELDPVELSDKKTDHYLKLAETEISLFSGARELIEYLHANYQLALVTSSHQRIQSKVFEKFKLNPFFQVIVTGDMVAHGKPHPEPYQRAVKMLTLEPQDCIVIEDSDNGILSAKAAGLATIGVTHTFPREKLEAAGTDYIVSSLEQIRTLF